MAVSVIGVAAVAAAQRRAPVVRDVPIASAAALEAFHARARALRAGEVDRLRVMHWGDSNVAADLWTSVVRRSLQRALGDGGPGYLLPSPFGSRFDDDAVLHGARGWEPRRYGFARDFGPGDGLWGLAGVAIEARGRPASLTVDVPWSALGAVVEVHALGRPRGGIFEVRRGGEPPIVIDTHRAREGLVHERIELGPGEHRLRVRVRGGRPVRLLGVVVEKRAPGVVYDVFGINGHRASARLEWEETLLREQIRHRPPDLVIMSYGGNEALDASLSMTRYEERLILAVDRMRALAPRASCLLVSPVAMCPLEPRNVEVSRIQAEVAQSAGCAFFHTAEVSGGHGSLCGWIRAGDGLVSRDRLHLGRRGYAIVGERFTRALLVGL